MTFGLMLRQYQSMQSQVSATALFELFILLLKQLIMIELLFCKFIQIDIDMYTNDKTYISKFNEAQNQFSKKTNQS